MTALTATSAVRATGLVVVDTGTAWSGVGQGVVLVLRLVGAEHVVLPERDTGLRLAHLVSLRGKTREYMDLAGDLALARCAVPEELARRTLEEAHVRRHHGVTVVCLSDASGRYSYAQPSSVMDHGAELVVVGPPQAVESFVGRAPVLEDPVPTPGRRG